MGRSQRYSELAASQAERIAPPRLSWQAALPLALGLGIAVIFVYAPSLRNEFLAWDDNDYVRDNPNVQELSVESVYWAFANSYASNWHPLTWISHTLDCHIYGKERPWGHHLTNVLLHGLNAVLLLTVLWRLTGSVWASALVAGLFALHPLRVEVVAWVSQRKELLCTTFTLLTLLAYVRYAARPSARRYALVILLFAAALMSKSMAVTLPFVLLLLDWWPLGRLGWRAAVEKAPLMAMSAASCIVTVLAQTAGGATRTLAELPLTERLANFAAGYVGYLGNMLWPWPGRLVPYYPLAKDGGPAVTLTVVTIAVCLLVAITVMVVLLRRRLPYLLVSWFWFCGTLVPVSGLVQVGQQSMADRYTYVPMIGLYLALVWLASDFMARHLLLGRVASVAAVALLVALAGLSVRQQRAWRDSVSLWQSVATAFPNNAAAANHLGTSLWNRKGGDRQRALECYGRAVELKPRWPEPHLNRAKALATMKRYDEAIPEFRATLALLPDSYDARAGLALALERKGDLAGAAREYRAVLEEHPKLWLIHSNLAGVLEKLGDSAAAREHFAEAERLRQRNAASKVP